MFSRKGKGGEREEVRRRAIRQPHLSEGQDNYTFRRSRTISGSLSNTVSATNAKRPDLKSDRVKLHELHASKRFLRSSLGAVILLVLVCGFLLSNSVMFASIQFSASSAPASSQDALRRAVRGYINSNPSQALTISLDETRLTRAIQANHPEVAAVEVKTTWFDGGDTLLVHFRTPIVVWEIGGQRFYVDKHGVAFKHYYGPEPALKVEDITGYMPELAEEGSVASQQFIGYLGQLLGDLRAVGVGRVERVVVPPVPRQLNIYLEGREYPIKTHTSRDPYVQAQDIKHALQFFDKQQITPQYVDVRVEGKAFYK